MSKQDQDTRLVASAENMSCMSCYGMFTFVGVDVTGNIVVSGCRLRLDSGKTRGQPDQSRDEIYENNEDVGFSAQLGQFDQ